MAEAPQDPYPESTESSELVVRTVPLPESRRAALRTRIAEIARHPAVVTTATVGAGVAASVVRELVRNGWPGRGAPAGPLRVTAHVIQEVHVIHHVVHHMSATPQRPPQRPPLTPGG